MGLIAMPVPTICTDRSNQAPIGRGMSCDHPLIESVRRLPGIKLTGSGVARGGPAKKLVLCSLADQPKLA